MSLARPRYALYFAPDPAGALWRFGSRTIGYDAASGVTFPAIPPDEVLAADWEEMTAEPRRYGFHATLKAPFELHDEHSEAELIDAMADFGARHGAVRDIGLKVAALGAFVALVPGEKNPVLQDLSLRIVEGFEPFRAPISAADRTRRLASPLSERQIAHLDQYGYPYVGEDFRFHMTLTGKLAADRIDAVRAGLAAAFLAQVPDVSTSIDNLALYFQPERAARFRIVARVPLMGG